MVEPPRYYGGVPVVMAYLLPFGVGLVTGCTLVMVMCWGEMMLCQESKETLIQVVPALQLETGNKGNDAPWINVSDYRYSEDGRRRTKTRVISLMPGCPGHPLHILILMLSAPNSLVRRKAIRGTWMHDYRFRVVRVTAKFLIGVSQLNSDVHASLKEEQSKYRDLVLLKELRDSYFNLSTKVLLGFKWAYDTVEDFDYLVKVDDDSYVRIEGISDALRATNCEKMLYWGYFMGHAFPEATGKWAEWKWFNCPHYFPYAMGGGYVLSRGAIEILMQFPDRLTLYNNEDVTVSSWLVPYRLKRQHDIRFNTESQSHGCMNWYLMSHKEKVRSFFDKYSNLVKTGKLCAEEKEIHPAYVYNWTSSPLNCCQRRKDLTINNTKMENFFVN